MAPVTAFWGPVVSYNLLALGSPVGAALGGFSVGWLLTHSRIPAAAGGWLFGFSTYEFAHLVNDANIFFVAWLPALMAILIMGYQRRLRGRRLILAIALLTILQLGTSVELLATFSLMLGLTAASAVWLVPGSRSRIWSLGCHLAGAWAIGSIVMLPLILAVLDGVQSLPASARAPYVADLANLIVPTQITAVGGQAASVLSARFEANIAENGAYVGIPALLMCCWWYATHWQSRWTRVLLIVTGASIALSLGQEIHVVGSAILPGPWALVRRLPLIGFALPVRFSLFTSFGVAVVAALVLDDAMRRTRRRSLLALAALTSLAVTVLPASHSRGYFWLTDTAAPQIFTNRQRANSAFPPGSTAVILPYSINGDSMLWQAQDHFAFKMAGGYVGFTPSSFGIFPAVQAFMNGTPGPDFPHALVNFVRAKGVDEVAVENSAMGPWAAALNATGWAHRDIGGITVYTVPSTARSNTKDPAQPVRHNS